MGRVTLGVFLALLVSLLANAWQVSLYLTLRDRNVAAQGQIKQLLGERDGARQLANACSDATDDLRELADKRKQEAKGVREQASGKANAYFKRADETLSRPIPVPGDSCASAQVQIDEWLSGRGQK